MLHFTIRGKRITVCENVHTSKKWGKYSVFLTYYERINNLDETKLVDIQMRSQAFHSAAISSLYYITLVHCLRRAQNCAA
jgi:4-hydroxyphenylpyruvate dioxygenase-like putative hemolysin